MGDIPEEDFMQEHPLLAASKARAALPSRLALSFALALTLVAPAWAQSFLGTIRGTVVDPQGALVAGATILIVDESTGVPRSATTDAQGRYEATSLRPGTYRVEVVTTTFKKAEKTGVLLKASATALVDIKLELGAISETVTVSAEAQNNITLESQAIARGLDEQQLRDLPRNSRDIQSFLLLNPNVLGGFDDIQFQGGRTYGVSYIQDGQASTDAIFGTIGNSAPGLDAISEMEVLSNSYSAEYGGLAGVVVTTKRGGNDFHGTAFYDFNSSGLNALTYNEKLAGAERGDPNSDTHSHRWGASFGGPLKSGKTFFHASYEGSNNKAVYGGGKANVPTAAMRNGDFSATTIVVRDPLTGQPFPGNVIPANRIDPAAKNVLDFFYPLPNQGTLASGMGVFQQFVPETQNRNRADLRIDHEASKNDSLFLRGSYQHRDPNAVQFNGGTRLTNLGIRNTVLNTATVIAGWTRIFSSTVVNEFRAGYNSDRKQQQSTYNVQQVNAQLGLENLDFITPERAGFPNFTLQGGSSSTRPTNIDAGGIAADRTVNQNSFSMSDNLSWITGGHSFKAGALWTRNSAIDGRGRGVGAGGEYRFDGSRGTGSALGDLLLGLPSRDGGNTTNRGDTDGHSNDFAVFLQDDWKVNSGLTVFLGLRYELQGAWHENGDILGNFLPTDGGHHVVPNQDVAALLPPGVIDLGRTQIASDIGLPDTLINTDKNNFSPRVGFAWRLGSNNMTVLRGGFGLFHPTVAIQGLRDSLASNMFRYSIVHRGTTLSQGVSSGTASMDPTAYGSGGIDPNIKSPDIYQYNLTLERELPGGLGLRVSYIGSTMRGLLINPNINALPPSTTFFDPTNPADRARLPLPLYNTNYTEQTRNGGSGQFNAAQVELLRRYKNGLALNVAYTLAHSDSNAPDSGNSSVGVIPFNVYDLELDRGPDPNVVKHRVLVNATWDIPVGHGRSHGSSMPGWANALFGGWTVSTLFQARTGNNLTPFFYGYYSTSPWNTGASLDGLGNCFAQCWRPDQISNPNIGGTRDQFYNVEAYAMPAPGVLGNAKKGSLLGPGTWVVNFAFYKDIVAKEKFKLQFSALLDNAFNHPQFFIPYGYGDSGFAQLDDWLFSQDAHNGTTGVLGVDPVDNKEGFAPGRVFRIGLRATF
jgi:hypothetical protein